MTPEGPAGTTHIITGNGYSCERPARYDPNTGRNMNRTWSAHFSVRHSFARSVWLIGNCSNTPRRHEQVVTGQESLYLFGVFAASARVDADCAGLISLTAGWRFGPHGGSLHSDHYNRWGRFRSAEQTPTANLIAGRRHGDRFISSTREVDGMPTGSSGTTRNGQTDRPSRPAASA